MSAPPSHQQPLSHDGVTLRLAATYPTETSPWGVPAWRFDILETGRRVGTISLRDGQTYLVTHLAGQVGFGVDDGFRGRGLAGRAARAILPLAAARGLKPLWLTTTAENLASRRTLERLGATFIEAVEIPENFDAYALGQRFKLRYRLDY